MPDAKDENASPSVIEPTKQQIRKMLKESEKARLRGTVIWPVAASMRKERHKANKAARARARELTK